jgi:hypothetical protein
VEDFEEAREFAHAGGECAFALGIGDGDVRVAGDDENDSNKRVS